MEEIGEKLGCGENRLRLRWKRRRWRRLRWLRGC